MPRVESITGTGLPRSSPLMFVLLCGALSAGPSSGQVPAVGEPLTEAVARAQLAFYGQVTGVDYRLSREGVPHTLVSYRIDRVLRGSVTTREPGRDRSQVTLRFVGGPKGNGTYLTVEGVPSFNPGDQDVLLVQQNGAVQCPLVNCERGRFRVLHDHVYSSRGFPLAGLRDGRIMEGGRPEPQLQSLRYPPPTFDQLYQREEVRERAKELGLSVDELRRRYEEQAPKEIVLEPDIHRAPEERRDTSEGAPAGEEGVVPAGEAKPMSLQSFLEIVSQASHLAPSRPEPVVSLDPDEAFSFELPVASAPGETLRDAEEVEKMRQQGFDPVIREEPPSR
jgi:hypothetical protein